MRTIRARFVVLPVILIALTLSTAIYLRHNRLVEDGVYRHAADTESTARWEEQYEAASRAYESYLSSYPRGRHAGQAAEAIERCEYRRVALQDSGSRCADFLERFPEGQYARRIRAWQDCVRAGTTEAYLAFARRYPADAGMWGLDEHLLPLLIASAQRVKPGWLLSRRAPQSVAIIFGPDVPERAVDALTSLHDGGPSQEWYPKSGNPWAVWLWKTDTAAASDLIIVVPQFRRRVMASSSYGWGIPEESGTKVERCEVVTRIVVLDTRDAPPGIACEEYHRTGKPLPNSMTFSTDISGTLRPAYGDYDPTSSVLSDLRDLVYSCTQWPPKFSNDTSVE